MTSIYHSMTSMKISIRIILLIQHIIQEDKMKKLYTIVISLMLIGTVFAQKPRVNISNAAANYLQGLNHDNAAIAESAIYNVMLLKRYYPNVDFSKISAKLDDLTVNGQNKSIRIKAFIATNYIKNPDQNNWMEQGAFAEAVAAFGFNLTERENALQEIKGVQN